MRWPRRLRDFLGSRTGQPLAIRLDATSGASDIRVGAGAISQIGEWVRDRWPKARRSWIVTDGNVGPLHAAAVEDGLRASGFAVSTQYRCSG